MDHITLAAVLWLCALCFMGGFVAGCFASLFDRMSLRQCSRKDALGCPLNPVNYK
jgi:hypothetical protein